MFLNSLKFKYYILIFSVITFYSCKTKPTFNTKPNIIFILTDDQRFDALGVMGNRIIQTPNLDKLANDGMLFKNAFVTTSICCVSRASILTGQYESRHKINDFTTSLSENALKKTYPNILKESGYEIGFIGKYGVGNPKDQPKNLFDYWKCTDKHQPHYENIDEKGDTIHYTDIIANNISEFLDSPKSKPFCLSVSFKAPHAEDGDARQFIPKKIYANYYKNVEIPQPETANPKYWESMPPFFKSDDNIARQRWKQRFDTPEKYQEMVKNYYRLINGVDDVVGDLRKLLNEKKLDKNTIIIFMGDNGMYLGEHGLAGKWFGHEESIRVPLIIYDPRTTSQSPKIIDDIALNIDIAPTILQLAGVEKPENMQGEDLLNRKKLKSKNRDSFFYEHTFLGSPKLPKVEGVVSKSLKYLNYIEYDYEVIYDLENDPHEKYNLINNPKYSTKLDSLRHLYKVLKEEVK
jgi:arylsulfatase A-like enzyme